MKTFLLRAVSFLLLPSLLTSCFSYGNNTISPTITYNIQDYRLQSLPSAFTSLKEDEVNQEWGKEYKIGLALAKELDLYRAVTAFKRADILAPKEQVERKLELQYYIVLSYYLGHLYEEAIDSFNHSDLVNINSTFPVYQDLLVILYESYVELGEVKQANHLITLLEQEDNTKASKLKLSKAMQKGELYQIQNASYTTQLQDDNEKLMKSFNDFKKSEKTAQALNAFLPGAGYLYVGQKQTALTAFLLNGLCIASTAYFFKKGNMPMGILMAGFEAGWYVGGIYGAGEAARTYNERLYENNANQVMRKNDLFPVLTLNYAF
ncbi:MAG: tetratricopeptide repeat protein [Rhabdochlamydiaceae bacterium]|nr:tetratricopeptide repeat protein [Candidatus Amphrikana amoebophyrae]